MRNIKLKMDTVYKSIDQTNSRQLNDEMKKICTWCIWSVEGSSSIY